MNVRPISYLTVSDLLQAVREQERDPVTRQLLSQVLMATVTSPNDEAARVTVSRLLAHVQDVCRRLSEDLRRRHPRLPTDAQEQAQLWQTAIAELREQWGYEDITERVRRYYEEDAHSSGKPSLFVYRSVLQSPENVYYIHTLADLLIVLDDARQAATQDTTHVPREEDEDAPRV